MPKVSVVIPCYNSAAFLEPCVASVRRQSLEDIEREVIRRTLAEVTNHREKAARMLGISLRTLQYKIKQYGIAE